MCEESVAATAEETAAAAATAAAPRVLDWTLSIC